jgi:hypothetical protein
MNPKEDGVKAPTTPTTIRRIELSETEAQLYMTSLSLHTLRMQVAKDEYLRDIAKILKAHGHMLSGDIRTKTDEDGKHIFEWNVVPTER